MSGELERAGAGGGLGVRQHARFVTNSQPLEESTRLIALAWKRYPGFLPALVRLLGSGLSGLFPSCCCFSAALITYWMAKLGSCPVQCGMWTSATIDICVSSNHIRLLHLPGVCVQ